MRAKGRDWNERNFTKAAKVKRGCEQIETKRRGAGLFPTPFYQESVPRLKDMRIKTTLVMEGAPISQIVVPPGDFWISLGKDIQVKIEDLSGAKLQIKDADQVSEDDYDKFNMILLGNMVNNKAILRLYLKNYCFTDEGYPGKGGFEVRTIHDPFGNGRNFILLGGSDLEEVRKAVENFLPFLKGDKNITLDRISVSKSIYDPHTVPDKAERSRIMEEISSLFESQCVSAIRQGIRYGMLYYQTNQSVYGMLFRDIMYKYIELAKKAGDWMLEHMIFIYSWLWQLVMTWDLIEDGEVFTDEDRLKLTNLLLNLTKWVANLPYYSPESNPPGMIRQNHSTFCAISMFYGGEYFRKYYGMHEFDEKLEAADRILRGQENSFKPNDDAAGYIDLAISHLVNYLLYKGEFNYFEKEKVKMIADYSIVTIDNRKDGCTYGDTGRYSPGAVGGLEFLLKAAWYHNDGRYMWAYNWIRGDEKPYSSFPGPGHSMCSGGYYKHMKPEKPVHLLGVKPIMLEQGVYDWVKKYTEGPNVASEKAFDKLSFRQDFDPKVEYMLLEGLSACAHGHEDGNSIVRLIWKDRIWLADNDYIKLRPKYHNSVEVIRNGERRRIPPLTGLEHWADFPKTGFTQTSVPGYNGVNWTRNIIWRKGQFFLIIDEIMAEKNGEYDLKCMWRTLGETKLEGGNMSIAQEGTEFHIINCDDSMKDIIEQESGPLCDWSKYPYAKGNVRVFRQRVNKFLEKGQRVVYINLLSPQAILVKRVGSASVLVSSVEGKLLLGIAHGDLKIGEVSIDAEMFIISQNDFSLVNSRSLHLGKLIFESKEPVSVDMDLERGKCLIECKVGSDIRLRCQKATMEGKEFYRKEGKEMLTLSLSKGKNSFKVLGLEVPNIGELLEKVSKHVGEESLRR